MTLITTSLFASFSSKLIDKDSIKPISGAMISDSLHTIKSDSNGSFIINSDENIVHIKAYGYRSLSISTDDKNESIILEPITVKALYLSFWGANINSKTLKKIMKIIDEEKINSLVIDVKTEYGITSYKTSFAQANKYGSANQRTIKDIKKFMNFMKSKNIYTIARIVTFKDELQASNNPEYAIKNAKGEIWRNHDNMAWVDPYDKRSHEYTIAIAEDAAKVGFDEINFDYIRFPAKTNLRFSKKNTQENRIKAIGDFLSLAQDRLRKYGTFISVDTYGNICWSNDDTGIGQTVKSLAKNADYLSPMLYPSGFARGSFGRKHPANSPYIVIHRSIDNIMDEIDSKRVRPWLQHFRDYTSSKRQYRKFEINEQIRATQDVNTSGWMMWSPSSKYYSNYFNK